MIFEKSCGAVIYTRQNGETLFLVEKMKHGHVSICKGHVEPGETEHDTARREIREETALEVTFIGDFRERIEYSPYPDCVKEVIFFLAEAGDTAVVPQEIEVSEIRWLPFDEAIAALTHASDREVLRAAKEALNA